MYVRRAVLILLLLVPLLRPLSNWRRRTTRSGKKI